MIIVPIDPGLNGGMVVMDGNKIISSTAFKNGLPRIELFCFARRDVVFIRESHDWKNVEIGKRKKSGKTIHANAIAGSGYYCGLIDQWLAERGVKQIEKVDALKWERALGVAQNSKNKLPGETTKERAYYWVRSQYNESDIEPHVYGPRGGLLGGVIDAICVGNYWLNMQRFKPIGQVFDEIIDSVPEEDFNVLPKDGSKHHDHYIYGTPKRRNK